MTFTEVIDNMCDQNQRVMWQRVSVYVRNLPDFKSSLVNLPMEMELHGTYPRIRCFPGEQWEAEMSIVEKCSRWFARPLVVDVEHICTAS